MVRPAVQTPRFVERVLVFLFLLRLQPAVVFAGIFLERLDVAELGQHFVCVLVPVLDPFGQHLEDEPVHLRRTLWLKADGGGTAVVRCFFKRSSGLVPRNGGSPVKISNRVIPKL